MARVRISQNEKTATQSGRKGTDGWVVEFEVEVFKISDGEMQWKNSTNTNRQMRLHFISCESAENWAKKNGHSYRIIVPNVRKIKPKAYADNFSCARIQPWTH